MFGSCFLKTIFCVKKQKEIGKKQFFFFFSEKSIEHTLNTKFKKLEQFSEPVLKNRSQVGSFIIHSYCNASPCCNFPS